MKHECSLGFLNGGRREGNGEQVEGAWNARRIIIILIENEGSLQIMEEGSDITMAEI